MKKGLLIGIIIGTGLLTLATIVGAIIVISGTKTKDETHVKNIAESFTNINIDVETSDVELKLADDNKTQLVLVENSKDFHKVEVKDNTLTVKYVSTRQWFEKISFNNKHSVTVFLPDVVYNKLTIEASTGDVKVSSFKFVSSNVKVSTGDVTFNKVNIADTATFKSSTGDFSLKDISAKSLDVSVSTGKINVEGAIVAENAKFNASTGSMYLKKLAAKNLETKSSTGNVTLDNTIIEKNINIKTDTGNVKFVDSDAETLNIKTDTGNISGNLLTSKIIHGKSDTGRENYPHLTEGGLCEIETDTGNIDIEIKK